MDSFKITKEELMKIAKYKSKEFPKYAASIINLLNRWARGTFPRVVGQMSDEVVLCPYKEHDKWREWYIKRHPHAINDAVDLIIQKFEKVKKNLDKIDRGMIKIWVEDLVIDKSFLGLKIQEAILQKIEEKTGIKCRLATKEEESKGFDGFIGDKPVQIKPDTYKVASNVKTEKSRARKIYYKKIKEEGDYEIDLSEIKNYLNQD